MEVSRRNLLGTGSVFVIGAVIAGCSTVQQNPTTGTYGLSPAVIAYIANAVQLASKYAPAVESIAAVAASLFGAQYSALVTLGSTAINQVIGELENLVTNPPTVGGDMKAPYAKFGIPMPVSQTLIGYTHHGVPVFAG